MKKAALVRSNYIPHTFNPCGDVTVSYLLWAWVCFSHVHTEIAYTRRKQFCGFRNNHKT